MRQTRELRKIRKILLRVKSFREQMRGLRDEELSGLTDVFRRRYANGESLDSLLPEAYAAMCEADYRVLGKFPYDVQIMGAIALHKGYLAQMNTGEGKTLSATLPLYLNALTGKGCFLLTTNGYLALRDATEMGPAYRFMKLTIASSVNENEGKQFSNQQKKEIYASDIVYTTHSVLGFDYLFHNLVKSPKERFLRELYYVIIDEADSVLLDSARTPLVISGAPRVQSNLYEMCDFFVTTLEETVDYEVEDQMAWLTEQGVSRAETYFGIDNFNSKEHFEIHRHVFLALRAHMVYQEDRDYKVSDEGEIVLLDAGSGRMMKGVKMRGGQHQALEAKEKVAITKENRSMASITYQNLFRLFEKMSGMSGTIAAARDEFMDVYHVPTVVIPPNFPVQRMDYPDKVYTIHNDQFEDALRMVLEHHATGQPVLVVASSIAETEVMSYMLMEEGIAHNVLNANNEFWEAQIIKEAGKMHAVTVATSMAGRGTDIKLGEGVRELGGLAVVGIGRMKSIREERQARGRAGRQGDPGCSRFFISLEDDVVTENGADMTKYIEGTCRMSERKMKKVIQRAQTTGEENGVSGRRQSLQYDQIMQKQRMLIYEMRDQLLDGRELEEEQVCGMAKQNIQLFLSEHKRLKEAELRRYIFENISYRLDDGLHKLNLKHKKSVEQYLENCVHRAFKEQQETLGSEKRMAAFLRRVALEVLDEAWVEQVDYLQQLTSAVLGRSSAQRNPVFEYQKEAALSFREMELTVKRQIVRNILLSDVSLDENGKMQIIFP